MALILNSAEPAGDVVFGLFFCRIGKNLRRRVVFDQFANIKEGGIVGNARNLLHIMSNNNDDEVLFQIQN